MFNIAWAENGGPQAAKPEKTSFGTTLIGRSVEGQLHGKIAYQWRDGGLMADIEIPLSALAPQHRS